MANYDSNMTSRSFRVLPTIQSWMSGFSDESETTIGVFGPTSASGESAHPDFFMDKFGLLFYAFDGHGMARSREGAREMPTLSPKRVRLRLSVASKRDQLALKELLRGIDSVSIVKEEEKSITVDCQGEFKIPHLAQAIFRAQGTGAIKRRVDVRRQLSKGRENSFSIDYAKLKRQLMPRPCEPRHVVISSRTGLAILEGCGVDVTALRKQYDLG